MSKKTQDNYTNILRKELKKRLNRDASEDEFINADKDSDIVNEALWQLINDLDDRVDALEDKVEKLSEHKK